MTLNDLLKFNKEIDTFEYLIIVDETDKRLKTCSIVTGELCISKDYENIEVISTRKVDGTHRVDGICYYGVFKPSQKGGLIVEVLNKKSERI